MRTFVLVLGLTLCAAAHAQDSKVDDLERKLEEQQEAIDRLNKQLEELEKAGEPEDVPPDEALLPEEEESLPEDDVPPPEDEGDWLENIELGIFYVKDKKKRWRVDIYGRIQVDGRFIAEHGHDDLDDSFLVRRARIEFRASLYDRVILDLGLEFGATGDADARNAYIELIVLDELTIRVGQTLVPYSDERLTSSKYLNHPERTVWVANNVADREVGVMLHGPVLERLFYYSIGVFNGDGQNVKIDTDDDFDYAFRLEVRPLRDDNLAITANYIYTPTNRSESGPSDVKTVGGTFTTFLDYDDANNRRLGRRQRAGAGLKVSYGSFEVKGEVNADYQESVTTATFEQEDLLTWSWTVGATWVLTGEQLKQKHTGFKVEPNAPFFDADSESFGLGALQVSLRYEDFIADDRAIRRGFATGTDRVRAATVSAHWYLWKEVRFTVSYTYSNFDERITDSRGRRHHDESAVVARFAAWF